MFEKLFGKKHSNEFMPDETPREIEAPTSPGTSADETQIWRDKILASNSDEAALLQLVFQVPSTELKLEALQHLKQEDSLRRAMREFREKDKRLYRAAKSRWQAANDTRDANEEADGLIAAANALLSQENIPVNRVVELDRAWSMLKMELLDAAVPVEFAKLSEQLGLKVRADGTRAQLLGGWLSAVDMAVEQLSALLPGIAHGNNPSVESESVALRLLALLDNVPDASDSRCVAKADNAKRLLALASNVTQRAQFLQTLPIPSASDVANEKSMIEQWRAFPELSDGDNQALHSTLAQRFADWRNAFVDARKLERDAHSANEREQRAVKNQQRSNDLQREIDTAEAAHASGQVAELARLLTTIDQMLKRDPANAELAQRIEFLRREQIRLRDWQQWSGKQSREQLAVEAQELAQLANGKIALKVHAESIAKLRERWKELDKLDGASDQGAWLSFDGALKLAYAPVAAHLDKLKLARQDNLTARDQVIAELAAASSRFFTETSAESDPIAQPDWRAVVQTLEQARIAWQKLGPVAHTVPRAALQGDHAVTSRYAAAVQALEFPLKSAYDEARQKREQLIAAAKQLSGSDVHARDVVDKVRSLQSQWQSVAKSVPLPRFDENSLWTAFKSATDAIFVARDAARAASETELTAQLQAREAVIERLMTAVSLNSAAELKPALAEADSAWRAAGDVAKPLRAKLDARYRAARDGVETRLRALALFVSRARFDALIEAMALCRERESLQNSNETIGAGQSSDVNARWEGIMNLPEAWKAPMSARFNNADGYRSDGEIDRSSRAPTLEVLLNLEIACGLESPNEFLAARQQLKIRALKTALEGRQATHASIDQEAWLLKVAAQPYLDEQSANRLTKVIAVMRNIS